MTAKLDRTEDEQLLDGIPDHMKSKLLDMMNKIDNVESVVSQLESLETSQLQSKVWTEFLFFHSLII